MHSENCLGQRHDKQYFLYILNDLAHYLKAVVIVKVVGDKDTRGDKEMIYIHLFFSFSSSASCSRCSWHMIMEKK